MRVLRFAERKSKIEKYPNVFFFLFVQMSSEFHVDLISRKFARCGCSSSAILCLFARINIYIAGASVSHTIFQLSNEHFFFSYLFFFHSFIVNGAATVESTSHCCAFNMKIRSTVPGRFDAKNKFCMNFHKINFIFIEMANKMELITLLDREVGLERLNIYGRILFYHKWNRHNYKFV